MKISCPTADQLNHASFDKYPEKNRYKDIVCIEESRVKVRLFLSFSFKLSFSLFGHQTAPLIISTQIGSKVEFFKNVYKLLFKFINLLQQNVKFKLKLSSNVL